MGKLGLTKGQRRRANERARKEAAKLFDALGPMPAAGLLLGSNLDPGPDQREPWERAPAHMVDYDECPSLRDSAVKRLSSAGCDSQIQKKDDQISEIKYKYNHLWGKRGKARIIAKRETAEGNSISERTIRRYFRSGKT